MGAHRMARQPGREEVLFGAAFNHQVPATASQTWGTREHREHWRGRTGLCTKCHLQADGPPTSSSPSFSYVRVL